MASPAREADDGADERSNCKRAPRNVDGFKKAAESSLSNNDTAVDAASPSDTALAFTSNRQLVDSSNNYSSHSSRNQSSNDSYAAGVHNYISSAYSSHLLSNLMANEAAVASIRSIQPHKLGLAAFSNEVSLLQYYLAASAQQQQANRYLSSVSIPISTTTTVRDDTAVESYLNDAAKKLAIQKLLREQSMITSIPLDNSSNSSALREYLLSCQEVNALSVQAHLNNPLGSSIGYQTNTIVEDSKAAPIINPEYGSRNDQTTGVALSSGPTKRKFADQLTPSSNNDITWEELVAGGTLCSPDYRGFVSDLDFAVVAQMTTCTLSHDDRVGLYKTREIGCRGVCCMHCGGVPGFGRYFPGSLASLVNGSITKSNTKHIIEDCRLCPVNIRDGIIKLNSEKSLQFQRGFRRQFFAEVWDKINDGQPKVDPSIDASGFLTTDVAAVPGNIPWNEMVEGSTIVFMSDRHLVPDTVFAATAQTRPCELKEEDRVGRCKDHKLGSMGLCCKYCNGKPGAFGRYFSSNLHTFAQVEVCNQIVKHITGKCMSCPPEIRESILHLQQLERSAPPKRYPSRMIFFRRVWQRFQVNQNLKPLHVQNASRVNDAHADYTIDDHDIPWDRLLNGSKIVSIDDKGLISDSQFAAIAQMDMCILTEKDKIGYNKYREIGFVGFACRYCGGRPGFGRYFPDTVRNLEKTSARDTIVSHISTFCKECPEDVRAGMEKLQRIETSLNGSATMKGLVYGSGKIFFRRMWSRLHGEETIVDTDDTKKDPRL